MPGNEVEDRIQTFFGQENLSQDQHHSQAVGGTWPGFSNRSLVGGQRQIGSPLGANLKNYNVQQTVDSESGPSSNLQHGQSTLRYESINQPLNHQPTVDGGYMLGNQAFHRSQNEANFLGLGTESDRRSLLSRDMSVIDSQLGNGLELDSHRKHSMTSGSTGSPVNYDSFGGQQQLISQHPGMLQSFSRPKPGFGDVQLLQKQLMFKQVQEYQRQLEVQKQHLQQQDGRQSNINHFAVNGQQATSNISPDFIKGVPVPVHDMSNYLWQSEVTSANTNWQQRSASQHVGSSGGLMFPPDQDQLRLMGLVPQQFGQSLYGVHSASPRDTLNQYSSIQDNKPGLLQMSASSNSFAANQYGAFSGKLIMQENNFPSISRQDYEGKIKLSPLAGERSNSELNLGNLQQVNQPRRDEPVQEFSGRQDVSSSLGSSVKTLNQSTSPKNNVTLDPDEEKILFGSDDNLWDAFGRGPNMSSGGPNVLDGSEFGALSTLQGGAWSALMQSAVAETSSDDAGLQEDWNMSNVQNSETLCGNQQPPIIHDGGKQQSAWADNSLHSGCKLDSRPFLSDNINSGVSYSGVAGAQLSGLKTSDQQNDGLRTDPSFKLVQDFPDERNKLFEHHRLQKPVAEGSRLCGNISQSNTSDYNLKTNMYSWINQQNKPGNGSGVQPCTRPNGWNFESMTPSEGGALQNHGRDRQFLPQQGNQHRSTVHEGMGRGAGMWNADSPSNIVENEQKRVSSDNGRVGSEINIDTTVLNSSIRANQEISKQCVNNLSHLKNVDSTLNSQGSSVSGKHQHHVDMSSQTFESLGNNGLAKGKVDSYQIDNPMKESSSDSIRTNTSQHTPTAGLKENAWFDASNVSNLPNGKPKSSGQVGRKNSVTRKFQYHPMGDLDADEEPSYGAKHFIDLQGKSHPSSRSCQGYLEQSKFSGQLARNSLETEKGCYSHIQGDLKGTDGVPSKNIPLGYVPFMPASFDRFAGNKTVPSSQNMLELLQKVDQSREHDTSTPFSSAERNVSSEKPEAESFDGSIGHLQKKQSSTSQGFGLQLGPPSHQSSLPDFVLSSQNSTQVNSVNSSHTIPEFGGRSSSWLPSMGPHETSQGTFRNNVPSISEQTSNNTLQYIQGDTSAFTPDFSSSINMQSLPFSGGGGQIVGRGSINQPSDRFVSQSKQIADSSQQPLNSQFEWESTGLPKYDIQKSTSNQIHADDPPQGLHTPKSLLASQPSITSGPSQQGAVLKSNAWANILSQQHPPGSQLIKPHPNFLSKPNIQVAHNLETKSHQISQNGWDVSSEVGTSVNPQGLVEKEQPPKEEQPLPCTLIDKARNKMTSALHMQGKEAASSYLSDISTPVPKTTQRDIAAFGRTLRPNNVMEKNCSLLHQVQAMKSAEIDHARDHKRFKGAEKGIDSRQIMTEEQQSSFGSHVLSRDASTNRISAASGDFKPPSFSPKGGDALDRNAYSTDMPAKSQGDVRSFLNSNDLTAVRGEGVEITTQTAPSCLDQYRGSQNGEISPILDECKITTAKTTEQPLIGEGPVSLRHCQAMGQVNTADQSSATELVMAGHDVGQSLVVVRPKKRKSATLKLLPWCKEVLHGSGGLQNFSVAEVEWLQATKRLAEKLEYEAVSISDGQPLLRSRRRLILTTQLMQQLFHPRPALVLMSDNSSSYECVIYHAGRAALGDACSTSSSRSDRVVPSGDGTPLSRKQTTDEKDVDHYISKGMEDFLGRAKKLEHDLLRFDNSPSLLDLRMECQDIEKFSVINRFAKFHGGMQTNGAETPSSSNEAANTLRFNNHRYITAVPMPKNLHDRLPVQCLSL